jgi:hypothetical protein
MERALTLYVKALTTSPLQIGWLRIRPRLFYVNELTDVTDAAQHGLVERRGLAAPDM